MTRRCSIDGCLRPHLGKGLCELHYARANREALRQRDQARYWKHRVKRRAQARRYARAHHEQGLHAMARYRRKKGMRPKLLVGPRAGKRYRGVTFHNQRKRYQARIRKGGILHSLGLYDTPAEAARAYNRGVKELYGDTPHFLNDVPTS